MCRVSVIVPVYQVEAYLAKCLDSILAQTFTDFELILVDDGTRDDCPRIMTRYAAMDARIRCIHKENGGLSSARNAGLDIARGEYRVCRFRRHRRADDASRRRGRGAADGRSAGDL